MIKYRLSRKSEDAASSQSTNSEQATQGLLKKLIRPATVLVFLFAAASVVASADNNSTLNQEESNVVSETVAQVSQAAVPAAGLVQAEIDSSAGTNTTITQNDSSVSVTVDGQEIEVPANGSVNKVINTEDGQTTVNVNTSQSSGRTSTHVHSHSFSHSFNNGNNQVQVFSSP